MGIIVPRPAMRAREERNVKAALKLHASITQELQEAGIDRILASGLAFSIVTTHAARKRIWAR